MAWLAPGLYLLGLLLAFGWRTVAQWRRTGDTGLRLDAGPPGTLRWWAKLLFVAALVLASSEAGTAVNTWDRMGQLSVLIRSHDWISDAAPGRFAA